MTPHLLTPAPSFVAHSSHIEVFFTFQIEKRNARLQKYDPDAAQTTLELQREMIQGPDGPEPSKEHSGIGFRLNLSSEHLSREQLQEKLAKRIEALRTRNGASASAAREWQQKQLKARGGVTKTSTKPNTKPGGNTASKPGPGARMDPAASPGKASGKASGKAPASGASEAAALAFSLVEDGEGKRRKKLSKQAALEKAVATKEKLAALQGTAEGREEALRVGWDKALRAAGGERVLDDPRLLKKSIKREAKSKLKSQKAWQERNKATEEASKAKKLKRFQNIAKKKQGNRAKRIEKRDNKLQRAGFEGRRQGTLNGSS